MHVVATAGHVDHGKSTLVRALTGMEPDRYAEERRRGMTLDLGFVWTTLPSGEDVAFVDVPGHERFVATMLAGVGPVPAVAVVVAADEGWMPQTEEHVAALDALGVRHGVLVVTKADAADPAAVMADARSRLARTSLGDVPAVAVSATTAQGLDAVLTALDELVAALPSPRLDGPVRLWVDRAFTVRGAGTVVTGTLPGGRLHVGDRLVLASDGRDVTVRGLESRKLAAPDVAAVARVAVNLRGIDRDDVGRGDALLTPGAWTTTDVLDVVADRDLPPTADRLVAHVGSAAVPVRVRRLGDRAARLRLATPLPLHLGDRLLLRDPARHAVVAGVDVADLAPPPLHRRGDAARIGRQLAVPAAADDEVARGGAVTVDTLRARGLDDAVHARHVGRWRIDDEHWARWRSDVTATVRGRDRDRLPDGLPLEELRRRLGVPDAALLAAVLEDCDGVLIQDGRVRGKDEQATTSPALAELLDRLDREPLAAPEAHEVAALDATPAALAAAVRAGRLVDLGRGVYVGAAAETLALDRLAALPQPFTTSEARQALESTRRVVVPLLEHLDRRRRTRRVDATRRVLVGSEG